MEAEEDWSKQNQVDNKIHEIDNAKDITKEPGSLNDHLGAHILQKTTLEIKLMMMKTIFQRKNELPLLIQNNSNCQS